MYNDDVDFGGADILDPKKKGLHDDELLLDDEDLEDPDFLGLAEDDDIFSNVGFGAEEEDF
jgi:hypothetical protein